MNFFNLTQEQYSLIMDEWKCNSKIIAHPIPVWCISEFDRVILHWELVNSDVVRDFLMSIGLEDNNDIDYKYWDELIENHYLSALKINSDKGRDYSKEHTREDMRKWWYSLLYSEKKNKLDGLEDHIIGSTHANNNGYFFHPV